MHRAVSSLVPAVMAACSALLSAGLVQASGPTERVLQVLPHPMDENVIVARYGVPGGVSNGFLYSSDGGKSFKAGCSDLIAPGIKLQRSFSPYLNVVHLDVMGRLTVSQDRDQVFVGDTTGCTFAKTPGFENTTGITLTPDPTDPAALFMLALRQPATAGTPASSEILRRDAAGVWTTVGALKTSNATTNVYGADLAVAKLPAGGTRMVAFYSVYIEGSTAQTGNMRVGTSEDGGKSWAEHMLVDPPDGMKVRLLAIDPTNPDRVLAVHYSDSATDKLLVSTDKGVTYQPYAEVDHYSGHVFTPEGRIFISSTRDSSPNATGGLHTAANLGEPLMKLPSSADLDSVALGPDQKLYGSKLQAFGTLDPTTGAFTEVTRLERVSGQIECPGKDVAALCEEQMNSGVSWCCAGHYPFTPFCDAYDVTRTKNGKQVLCGLSGQKYDEMAGRKPETGDAGTSSARDAGGATSKPDVSAPIDAGKPDAGARPSDDEDDTDDDVNAGPKAKQSDDGCSANPAGEHSSRGALFGALGLSLLLLRRARRRRSR